MLPACSRFAAFVLLRNRLTPGLSNSRFCTFEGAPVLLFPCHRDSDLPPGCKNLIAVDRISVLCHRFSVVAWLAEALPVRPIPEQLWIAAVRHDVVNHSGSGVYPLLHADNTQRMHLQVCSARLLPPAAVSASGCCPHLFRMQCPVFCTVFLSVRNQSRTAGMLTGCIWSVWHLFSPLPLSVAIRSRFFLFFLT